ncbi:MAG: PD40 domain-containing protein, partial [Candidatus Omnitrophica bacterium]|nr:PD40 domain-containing protein [Candidatus Omnitrophota bacterium]
NIYFYLVPTQKAKAIIKKQSNIVIVPGKIIFESSLDWKPWSRDNLYLLKAGLIEKIIPGTNPRFVASRDSVVFLDGDVQNYNLSSHIVKSFKIQAYISSVDGYDLSPDGKQLVFAATKEGKKNGSTIFIPNLYLINIDGTGLKQITFFDGDNFFGQPRWSPDGKQILFYKDDGERTKAINWGGIEQQAPSLYVINANGTGLGNLLHDTNSFGWHGSWSHDGMRVVFTMLDEFEIAVFDIATNAVHETTSAPSLKEVQTNLRIKKELKEKVEKGYPLFYKDHPVFSPDDTQIAFIGRCRGGYFTGSELFVVNANGGEIQRLTAPHWTRMGWAEIDSFDWAA